MDDKTNTNTTSPSPMANTTSPPSSVNQTIPPDQNPNPTIPPSDTNAKPQSHASIYIKSVVIVSLLATFIAPHVTASLINSFSTNDAERGIAGLYVLFAPFTFPFALVVSMITVFIAGFVAKNQQMLIWTSLAATVVVLVLINFIERALFAA